MNTPQPTSPRRRLQELQAIPDSERTDAEWDELNDLEIQLAPGNRLDSPKQQDPRRGTMGRQAQARPAAQPRHKPHPNAGSNPNSNPNAQAKPAHPRPNPGPEGEGQAKKPFRKFHKRPAKPNPPSGDA